MGSSRIAGLYKLAVPDRIAELERLGFLTAENARDLESGRYLLPVVTADKMVENVVGVFGLPMAIAPNFIVNGRESIAPLVVEEPSIVAGLSQAAALARPEGGFTVEQDESLLAGQIHVSGINDVSSALAVLEDATSELKLVAEEVHPRLRARGGGIRDIGCRELQLTDGQKLLAVHVLVDTCDAMGANLVNTICESIAPRVAEICGGDVVLRILSNLTDRSICRARVRYRLEDLGLDGIDGTEVRDRIVLANEIAIADPYRAATHNKGIMNGVDALAIATGNDWRAIEASAHAFAARGGRYSALTRWSVDKDGNLAGEIDLPVKPGTVGGSIRSNPGAELGLAISGAASSRQLAELMAAVGLAQNFAALRALVTSGIQKGHMRLHARSLASAAGASEGQIDEVVGRMLEDGNVKPWRARELVDTLGDIKVDENASATSAAGKIILLGEHAVVYGRYAVAIPIPDAVHALATAGKDGTTLTIPEWGICGRVDNSGGGTSAAINLILESLGLEDSSFNLTVHSRLRRGMGLGSSAALAVAITRSVARYAGIEIDAGAINEIAFSCEKLAHGTPSGIDNTVSCYGEAVLFRNTGELEVTPLRLQGDLPIVVAFSHVAGPTDELVAGVRRRRKQDQKNYEAIFDQIDELSRRGAAALEAQDYDQLGKLMNVCHGLLNAIGVSSPELENMVSIARDNGAVGAKLTGAGGGGSIVALCPGREAAVREALRRAGYDTLQIAAPEEMEIE